MENSHAKSQIFALLAALSVLPGAALASGHGEPAAHGAAHSEPAAHEPAQKKAATPAHAAPAAAHQSTSAAKPAAAESHGAAPAAAHGGTSAAKPAAAESHSAAPAAVASDDAAHKEDAAHTADEEDSWDDAQAKGLEDDEPAHLTVVNHFDADHAGADVHLDAGHGGGGHHGAHHANHLAVFMSPLAVPGVFEQEIGLDYERRLDWHEQMLGVSGFVELGFGPHDAMLSGAGVAAHPFKGLRIFVGAGLEHAMGAEHDPDASHEGVGEGEVSHARFAEEEEALAEEHSTNAALGRLSVGWDIHMRRLCVTPTTTIDLASSEVSVVYGAGLGMVF